MANLESFGLLPDGSTAWNPQRILLTPPVRACLDRSRVCGVTQLAMTYGDQIPLPDFANKVRTASLQHGLGHHLMSGNPTSEIGTIGRRKVMDKSWVAAQTEILSAERFSAKAIEMASLLRLLNRSIRHRTSDPIDQAYALPGLAYGGELRNPTLDTIRP
jgi:hypothetical protein